LQQRGIWNSAQTHLSRKANVSYLAISLLVSSASASGTRECCSSLLGFKRSLDSNTPSAAPYDYSLGVILLPLRYPLAVKHGVAISDNAEDNDDVMLALEWRLARNCLLLIRLG
jgi:hypothetical protein